MRSAPRPSAWSRKALNLISALHSTSGFGVRPAWYSARNRLNTRSRYSLLKFTASSGMPMMSATEAASIRSWRELQYSSSSSSSQFFMNRPTTSQPWRLSSSAATEESTPPDMPTTTRPFVMDSGDVMQQVQGVAPPRQVVLDAAQDQGAAVAGEDPAHLFRAEPVDFHDLLVQRPIGVVCHGRGGEGESKVGVAGRGLPTVYPHHGIGPHGPAGFLQRLPCYCRHEGLIRLQV